jgi:hypothetical protein
MCRKIVPVPCQCAGERQGGTHLGAMRCPSLVPNAATPSSRLAVPKFGQAQSGQERAQATDAPRLEPPLAPLTWAQRLKRVFEIDITLCPHCGGQLR